MPYAASPSRNLTSPPRPEEVEAFLAELRDMVIVEEGSAEDGAALPVPGEGDPAMIASLHPLFERLAGLVSAMSAQGAGLAG